MFNSYICASYIVTSVLPLFAVVYCTLENFGSENFWRIITDEAIGKENFGKFAGCLSVISLYLYIGEENSPKFSPPKFSHIRYALVVF